MDKNTHGRRRFTHINFDANCILRMPPQQWSVKLIGICFKSVLVESGTELPLWIGGHAELIIALDAREIIIKMPATINK